MASSADFDVTPEEVDRISKALKDEKFRQLFFEYAQEISDPENRKKYEEEITQLERNRGTDVVFVNPDPGYVIKTNVDGEQKAFINVCKSEKVGQPTSTSVRRDNGQVGSQWSVPHSLAPGKEDVDKGGQKCMVYDCVFHPDCFTNAEKDPRFYKLLDDTAFDSIESNFGVKLDRANVKKLTKMKFKGQARPTVIRTKNKSGPTGESDALKDFGVDYPFKGPEEKNAGGGNAPAKSATTISGSRNALNKKATSGPVEPKFSIIHRGHFDMQHFTNAPDSMPSTRPQELVVKIQLPLLKSIATVQLDVSEKQIYLECQKPASYRLDLPLPYPIDEENGSAKFDKSKSCLTITLPVLPPEIPKLPSFAPEPQNAPLIEEMPQSNNAKEVPPKLVDEPSAKDPQNRTEATNGMQGDEENQESQSTESSQQIDKKTSQESIGTNEDVPSTIPSEMATDENRCPSYIFRQDETSVSFILQVANIDADSLKKQISEDATTVSLKFTSKTNDAVSVPYSICVVFEPECQVQDMKVDVQATEGVLLLQKTAASHGEWSGFKAGVSLQILEDKLFLTEENVREHVDDTMSKRRGKRSEPASTSSAVECGVIEASEDKLVIELEAKTNGDEPMEDTISDAALSTVTDTVIDAVIGELSNTAASLKLDLEHEDSSPGSDTSNPSTPCSPSGLRSALKDGHHRRRAQRSVSFSEDVVVETMVSSSPRKAKGKNKRQQPPRPKRFITKLRDGSQNQGSCSDSEVHYWSRKKGKAEEEEEEEEFQEEVVFPDWVCTDKQTSSDSSGGENGTAVPDSNKKKKPKANKRQRKKMNAAKRAMTLDDDDSGMKEAWFEPSYPLRPSSSEGSLPKSNGNTGFPSKTKLSTVDKNQNHKQGPKKDASDDQIITSVESTEEDAKSKVSGKQVDEDQIPLEMQDHRTQSAVEFSNEVMFELDE